MRRILVGIVLMLILSTIMSMCISNDSSDTLTTIQQSTTSASHQQTNTSTSQIDTTKLHFYMFGQAACPHCRDMKELLPKIFGEDKFTYYELQGNEHNSQLFSELYNILGVTGVPVIGIFYDNHIVAIVEGGIPDPAKNVPRIVSVALEEGGVVFISDKTYVIPSNQTEIIKKLENIFTSGEASEE